jgi:uncharacterized protein (TIGR02270 family)
LDARVALVNSAVELGPYLPVVRRHAEEVAFIWSLRARAVISPSYTLHDLALLDERIDAHLDGLRVAEEAGILCSKEALAAGEPPALFPITVLALEHSAGDTGALREVLSLAQAMPAGTAAAAAAFGWVSATNLRGVVRTLLDETDSFARRLAIDCCGMHGVDPGPVLSSGIFDNDPSVRSAALHTAAICGRVDLLSDIRHLDQLDSEDRVSAIFALAILGDVTAATQRTKKTEDFSTATLRDAFTLMLRAIPIDQGHDILKRLATKPEASRDLVLGTGCVGDPAYVPWLIGKMADPKLARLAGESLSSITGVNLSTKGLAAATPPESSGPNDDPDDPNVAMDLDDGLTWPDPAKVLAWWQASEQHYQKGQRYFLGAQPSREHCMQALREGFQRQRIAAAQWLCLLQPGTPLFNTSAPAWRQQRLLSQIA